MAQDPFAVSPLQPSREGPLEARTETSTEPLNRLTLKQAARQAGCSDSTLRRLVKAGEVPFAQEETKTGFRYMFEQESVSIIAHKAAMRRPSGRPSSGSFGGHGLQTSNSEALLEASIAGEQLAALKAERDLLRAENARLWAQVERLTESVTRLALPASRRAEEESASAPMSASKGRGFWDWFLGRAENPGGET